MNKLLTMRHALASPDIFGSPEMLGGDTWAGWRALLLAIVGEELTADERAIFRTLTGREQEPGAPVDEFWAVIGRRGGKTRATGTLAAYLAACIDHRAHLAPGQRARLPVMAVDRRQAQEAFNYIAGAFDTVAMLRPLVESRTESTLSLTTRVDIEVSVSSFRAQRGFTAVAAILDEIAFWRSEDSANPDSEVVNAVRPLLSETGGPLIALSSPHARKGELFRAYSQHFGPKGDPAILVAQAPTMVMRPTFRQSVVDKAYADDPAKAGAEYGAQFRSDVETFISKDVVDAAVRPDRASLPRAHGVRYMAFVDAAGGSGTDSMTLAIAHAEEARGGEPIAVLDLVREVRPPFSPDEATVAFAEVLKDYGISSVTGDAYAGEWPRERFRTNGISYEVSTRDRSAIYRELLPLLNAGRTELLDDKRLISQLCGLERRVSRAGRDSINHPPGGHDDVINAAAGALVLVGAKPSVGKQWIKFGENVPDFMATLYPEQW